MALADPNLLRERRCLRAPRCVPNQMPPVLLNVPPFTLEEHAEIRACIVVRNVLYTTPLFLRDNKRVKEAKNYVIIGLMHL